MIRIKPEPDVKATCPKCSQPVEVIDVSIRSAFTMAECKCTQCEFEFYQSLPIGHTVRDTLTIEKVALSLLPDNRSVSWLSMALLNTLTAEKSEPVSIRKVIYERYNDVVILNTLDFLYGHVLLKLYNALHHLDHNRDLGLILIIPKSFEWLVPAGCAEIWIVDLKLGELASGYSAIRQFVSKELRRFDLVYLSKAYSHPEAASIDISRFSRVTPFNLADFSLLRPTITFVLREDRWWMQGAMDYWFYRLCRKLGVLKAGGRILSGRQNRLVKRTITEIRSELPGADFIVVGLGTHGNFNAYAHDERKEQADEAVEREWCRAYARSHLVIGVHGSNMLLPTAHAAGCIEILPNDRNGNIVQDISVRYADRKQLFLYRFVDQYASPAAVADKAVSIVENYEAFERNMCQNVYSKASEPQLLTDA